MKKIISLLLAACCFAATALAQPKPVKIAKNANLFTYHVYDYGESIDTSLMKIVLNYPEYQIQSEEGTGPFIPGYAHEITIINFEKDSCFQLAKFAGLENSDCYEVASAFSRSDIAYDTARVNGLTRYTCHINSNTLEFFVQDYPYDINPLPYYGRFKGIVVCFKRNNQTYLQLAKTEFWKKSGIVPFRDGYRNCQRITGRELSQIKKQKLVITTRRVATAFF